MIKHHQISKYVFLLTNFILVVSLLLSGCGGGAVVEEEGEGVVTQEEEMVKEEGVNDKTMTLPKADIIFFNGQVLTMETDMPLVEALAIKGEDILAVGSDEEILELSDSATQVVDLGGKALLPGFVDTHVHYFRAYCSGEMTLDELQDLILKTGTTSVGEMTVDHDMLIMLQDLEQTDRLRVRTSAYLSYTNNCGELMGDWYLEYPPVLDTSRMLRIPGVKMFSDGGSCMRAAMSVNRPEWNVLDDPKGDLFFTSEELAEMVRDAQSNRYQVAIHALGDRGTETVLDAFEAALDGQPNTYRHRLEHNNLFRPDYIHRYGEIGVVVSGFWLSPGMTWMLDSPDNPLTAMIDANPEAGMTNWLQPWRSLLDANPGLHACWQTDWRYNLPNTGIAPIPDLFSMVTRKKLGRDGVSIWEPPDWFAAEAITMEEALRIMTIEGAYAMFMEDKIGSLKPGKFADLVILSQNPLTVDPDEIINIQVLLTMVSGKAEYCTPGFESLCPDATEPVEETQTMVQADIIFFNGQVLTMEMDIPQAEALAIQGRDVLAVGTNEEILNLKGSSTQVIDLEGKTLMPGFIDAHTHILEDAIQSLNFQSFEEVQQFEFEHGITAIGWPGPTPGMMRDFYDNWLLRDGGDLRLRVNLYMKINTKCYGLLEEGWYLDYPIILDPWEPLRIPGIKIYLDPFGGKCPGFGGRNYLLFTEEELAAIIADVQERGYQVAIHVAGEEGIEVALNAIEAALDGQPNTYRHRIEHSTFVKPESVPRYSEVDVVAVCPGYEAYESLGCGFCEEFLAMFPDQPDPDWFRPLRPLLDTNPGLCMAWHGDWDCYRPVMQYLWGFVTRKRFAEDGVTICEPCEFMTDDALSVEEALRVMTINGAYAMRMEEKTGSLKPGKFADLIIISDNPLTVDEPDDILDIQILLTMVGGKVEYCASGQEMLCPLTP